MGGTKVEKQAEIPATTPYLWAHYRDDDPPEEFADRLYILCHIEGVGSRRLDSNVTEKEIIPLIPPDGQDHNVRVEYRAEGRRGALAHISLNLRGTRPSEASSVSRPIYTPPSDLSPTMAETLRVYTSGLDRAYAYAAEAQREALIRAERAQNNAAEAQLRFADAALSSQLAAAKESETARREMLKQEAEAAREARALERAHAEAVLNLKVAQPGVQPQPQPDLLKTGLDIFEKVSPLLGMGFDLLGGFDGIKEKATSAVQKMGAVSENSPLNRLMDILESGVAIVAEKMIDSTPEENPDTPSREAIIEGEVV